MDLSADDVPLLKVDQLRNELRRRRCSFGSRDRKAQLQDKLLHALRSDDDQLFRDVPVSDTFDITVDGLSKKFCVSLPEEDDAFSSQRGTPGSGASAIVFIT